MSAAAVSVHPPTAGALRVLSPPDASGGDTAGVCPLSCPLEPCRDEPMAHPVQQGDVRRRRAGADPAGGRGGPHLRRRALHAPLRGRARRGRRRRAGAADHVLHARARARRAPTRGRARRRGRRPGVHVRLDRGRLRAPWRAPVFVDVRPDTLNLDERALAHAVTERTRAIVPVHYAGVACELDEVCAVAGTVGAAVVEDNAHGLFGSYRGRPLGSFGALATQSFHETKNVTCGEGGALILNDAALRRRRRGAAREGHEPPAVLPRPGGQVHAGSRSARATSSPTCSRRSSSPSSTRASGSRPRGGGSGSGTSASSPAGRASTASGCRSSRPRRVTPTTSSTCCSRRSARARG